MVLHPVNVADRNRDHDASSDLSGEKSLAPRPEFGTSFLFTRDEK